MSSGPVTATRRLAHRLLERAVRRTPPEHETPERETPDRESPDLETALRLLDPRLAPTAEARRRIADEALALCQAARSRLGRDDRLRGELHSNLRIALRDRKGKPFSVLVPSVVLRSDGTAAVLVMAPVGDRGAEARARRYRFAVGRLRSCRADAFLISADGAVEKMPVSRSAPRGAAYPGTECSPSGRPQSGRTPR